MSSGEEGCVSSFEVAVDGAVESIDVFGVSLLLLDAAADTGGGRSICNGSPHKFFVMQNIPDEGENSGNLETCFDVPRKNCEMQKELTKPVHTAVWSKIENSRSILRASMDKC